MLSYMRLDMKTNLNIINQYHRIGVFSNSDLMYGDYIYS